MDYCMSCYEVYKENQKEEKRKIREAEKERKRVFLRENKISEKKHKELKSSSEYQARKIYEDLYFKKISKTFYYKIVEVCKVGFFLMFLMHTFGFPAYFYYMYIPYAKLWLGLLILTFSIILIFNKRFQSKRNLRSTGVSYLIYDRLYNEYNKNRRFYRSSDWINLRKIFLKKFNRYACEYCHTRLKKSEVEVDHVLPRSKFPEKALDINNLAISCKPCNASKGDRTLREWRGRIIL